MNTSRTLEERNLRVLGETVQIRLNRQQTQGAFALICCVTPPQGGVPSHVHSKENETFIVLEGLYEFRVGDSVIHGQPGTCLFAPKGIPHSFQNIGQNSARLMALFSPPGFEEYFEEVDAGNSVSPLSLEEIVALAQKYGVEPARPSTNPSDALSETTSRPRRDS